MSGISKRIGCNWARIPDIANHLEIPDICCADSGTTLRVAYRLLCDHRVLRELCEKPSLYNP